MDVEALAPDAASLTAARKLARPAPWSEFGRDERARWGLCKGSGAKPAPKIVFSTNDGNRASRSGEGRNGVGFGPDDSRNFQDKTSKKSDSTPEPTEGVKIISKPRANYTDEARLGQVQGKVVLRVTFSATGQIGVISVISGLTDGLTAL